MLSRLFMVLISVVSLSAVGKVLDNSPTEQMATYAKMLNEFSDRRRLNAFFVNECH